MIVGRIHRTPVHSEHAGVGLPAADAGQHHLREVFFGVQRFAGSVPNCFGLLTISGGAGTTCLSAYKRPCVLTSSWVAPFVEVENDGKTSASFLRRPERGTSVTAASCRNGAPESRVLSAVLSMLVCGSAFVLEHLNLSSWLEVEGLPNLLSEQIMNVVFRQLTYGLVHKLA